MRRRNVKHVHVELEPELYERFKKIVPEYGLTSIVVRKLVIDFVDKMETENKNLWGCTIHEAK